MKRNEYLNRKNIAYSKVFTCGDFCISYCAC